LFLKFASNEIRTRGFELCHSLDMDHDGIISDINPILPVWKGNSLFHDFISICYPDKKVCGWSSTVQSDETETVRSKTELYILNSPNPSYSIISSHCFIFFLSRFFFGFFSDKLVKLIFLQQRSNTGLCLCLLFPKTTFLQSVSFFYSIILR
jgi:hypothetical protein